MPGPLHTPTMLVLYPFRFRDPVAKKWIRARYVAERSELERRYAEREIVGEPEYGRRIIQPVATLAISARGLSCLYSKAPTRSQIGAWKTYTMPTHRHRKYEGLTAE